MSIESFHQFRQQEMNNQALKERIGAANSAEEMASLAVQAGREKGYDFTQEDALAAIQEQAKEKNWQFEPDQELSDEQLEAVAGGAKAMFTDNWGCG